MTEPTSNDVLIHKRIKQLENQNLKLKKILQTAIDIMNDDLSSIPSLQYESDALTQRLGELETQKKILENEIVTVKDGDVSGMSKLVTHLECEQVELRTRLDSLLNEIKKGNVEIEDLKTEDVQLKKALKDLEKEKSLLIEKLERIEIVKSSLSRESFNVRSKISEVENKKSNLTETLKSATSKEQHSEEEIVSHFKYIEQTYRDYIRALEEQNNLEEKVSLLDAKKAEISNAEEKSQVEINEAILTSNTQIINKIKDVKSKLETSLNENLMKSMEEPNNVAQLDVQISELENQRDLLYAQLQESLEQSSKEIQELNQLVSDAEIKKLVHEIEIQKAVLLYNLKTLKTTEQEDNSAEKEDVVIPSVSELEMRFKKLSFHSETTSGSSFPEQQTFGPCSSRVDHHKLEEEVTRLENERKTLLQQLRSISATSAQRFEERQLQTQSELHSTFMREESSQELVLTQRCDDDATNQLYPDDDARLRQRIRELEIENMRIRTELEKLYEDLNSKRDDLKEKLEKIEKNASLRN